MKIVWADGQRVYAPEESDMTPEEWAELNTPPSWWVAMRPWWPLALWLVANAVAIVAMWFIA